MHDERTVLAGTPQMSEAENRSARNLVVLCVEHATEVDLPHRVAEFSVEVLQGCERDQVAAYDEALLTAGTDKAVGWDLSPAEVAQVQHFSTDNSLNFRAETMVFGGLGGAAMGAGGGGGAAIGTGALGGPGGPGGQIILDGAPGTAPGAGGGGGASMASDAISTTPISIPEGIHGRGYSAGSDGEGGLAGTGVRRRTEALRVSSVMLPRYTEWSDTATIVGGGIVWYSVLNLPTSLAVTVFTVFEAGGIEAGDYTVAIEACNPAGERRGHVRFPVTVEQPGEAVRISRGCDLTVDVDSFGLWEIRICASDAQPVIHTFIVKRFGEG